MQPLVSQKRSHAPLQWQHCHLGIALQQPVEGMSIIKTDSCLPEAL
jgi:hypothetical protein